jgi:hypothetical protein
MHNLVAAMTEHNLKEQSILPESQARLLVLATEGRIEKGNGECWSYFLLYLPGFKNPISGRCCGTYLERLWRQKTKKYGTKVIHYVPYGKFDCPLKLSKNTFTVYDFLCSNPFQRIWCNLS